MSMQMQARDIVRQMWDNGLRSVSFKDPRRPEFATAALRELVRLREETPKTLGDALDGADFGATQLGVDDTHGLTELIQNADDQQASHIKFGVRRKSGCSQVVVAHNGAPVNARDVIAMCLAFVSAKRDDPDATGKFGIGLKTLARLSDRIEVYCNPYHFEIAGSRFKEVPKTRIESFYDPDSDDTLFVLPLKDESLLPSVIKWIESWTAHSMLFLSDLRRLYRIDLQSGDTIFARTLVERDLDVRIPWNLGRSTACIRAVELNDESEGRRWVRYDAEVLVPKKQARALKAVGDTTTISVAVPSKPVANVLYAGLPTQIRLQIPFAIGTAFDPNTSRTQIQQNDWNKWLWSNINGLLETIATHLLQVSPTQAWYLIPTSKETLVDADAWVQDRIEDMRTAICEAVRMRGRILNGEFIVPLADVAYESRPIEGALSNNDFLILADEHTRLVAEARDVDNRWRDILDDIEVGKRIEVADVLNLLPLCVDRPLDRQPEWYTRIVSEGLSAGLSRELENLPCILVDDPVELSSPSSSGPVYSTDAVVRPLAARLGLIRKLHEGLLGDERQSVQIREWLGEKHKLRGVVDSVAVLQAISHRGATEPLELSDADVTELRDTVDEIADPDSELLLKVGQSVLIDVEQWNGDERTPYGKAPVATVYLPAGIAGGSDPWPRAAARTPCLKWAAPRYGGLLNPGDRQSNKSGARRFLTLLGAHTVFQLDRQRYQNFGRIHNLGTRIPEALIDDFRNVAFRPKIIRDDYRSTDLKAVIENICGDSPKERYERGLHLVRVLDMHWQRSLQQKSFCPAYYFYYQENLLGDIPSEWIAMLSDMPWLYSEEGQPATPKDLYIQSDSNRRLLGNADHIFARGVSDDLAPGLAAALGFQERPRASVIVDILSEMKAGEVIPEWAKIRGYYAYLSDLCPDTSESLKQDDKVDDVTVGWLIGKFGIRRASQGLIATDGAWHTPSAIFQGRRIFGDRRSFVPAGEPYRRLWNVLRIHQPTVSDCVEVLSEIALDGDASVNAGVLTDTYRHLNVLLPKSTPRERRLLVNVPLWSGSEWEEKRPIYFIADEVATESLADSLTMWNPPCSLEGMDDLIEALGVTTISPNHCTPTGVGLEELPSREDLREQFASAVEALKDYLAKNHADTYGDLTLGWSDLADAEVVVSSSLGLEITLPSGEQVITNTAAHLIKSPLTVYVADEESLYDIDSGTRVISQCFGSLEHQQIVRLAWRDPGMRSRRSDSAMALAGDFREEGDPLSNLGPVIGQNVGRPIVNGSAKRSSAIRKRKITPPRMLKKAESLTIASAVIVNPDAPAGKRILVQKTASAPETSSPLEVGTRVAGGVTPMGYTPDEREQLALRVLESVVRDNESQLRDFTRIGGLGADAGDNLGRLFEIKAHGGDMPDSVNIQPSQVRAASENPGSFYLAVISGLEEGYETVVRLFDRPLETLNWERGTSIKLSGIRSKRAIEVRLGTD